MQKEKENINIVNYKVSDLIFAEYNPRELTKDQHQDLKDSITRFGFVDPLIVNTHKERKNILVGGHQRLKIAKELSYSEVPCVEIELTPDKEKELNVRLNKNTGQWNWDSLANYFDAGELLEWGFTNEDLDFFDKDYGDDFELPNGDKEPFQQMSFTLSDDQVEIVQSALNKAKKKGSNHSTNSNENGNALWFICNEYC
tara:strand:- start:1042 stop:1638 length:597 start_codon:yes stop_codon:yes gene_type:complete